MKLPHILGRRRYLALAIGLAAIAIWGLTLRQAATRFPGFFGNRMVLQREMPVPIWGWDRPGAMVTVSFAGQRHQTTAGADGRWQVVLDPMPAEATGQTLTARGTGRARLHSVLVGDVWLCGGQSNMTLKVADCIETGNPFEELLAEADLPLIRHVTIYPEPAPDGPRDDCRASPWHACRPEVARDFSAVALCFARRLQPEIGVPIGLLVNAKGGTPAEAWMRRPLLDTHPSAATYLAEVAARVEAWDPAEAEAAHARELADWQTATAAAEKASTRLPNRPFAPIHPAQRHDYPATLWNGMVAPVIPFGIKGLLWYHGEANAARAAAYEQLLQDLLSDWRTQWGQGDFPIAIVQLPNFRESLPEPSDQAWAELRYSQSMTASRLANAGLICLIDAGDPGNVHPKDKIVAGDRLARWALAAVYGRPVEPSGPVYRSLRVEGHRAIVHFDHTGSGLVAGRREPFRAFEAQPGASLARFQIAGEDRRWVWGDAAIEGDTVVVSSPRVEAPVAVRYAWSNNPAGCNLYNREGLPAVPFRTDDWPLITAGR